MKKVVPQTKGLRSVEANVPEYNRGPNTPQPQRNDSNITPINLPYDINAYVRAHRLVREPPELEEKWDGTTGPTLTSIVGSTIEVDCFTYGVKIFVRMGKDGTLKLFAEDGDGITKYEEWKK